ncbi:hypothetical protein [Flavobacterium sp.]|uniref:hypothetical protein n=1 Tax=Flavobacterium sp. TaxID=239 RepID=UPI003F695DB7
MNYKFFKKIISSYNDIQKISFNKDFFTIVDSNGIESMIFDYEKDDMAEAITKYNKDSYDFLSGTKDFVYKPE